MIHWNLVLHHAWPIFWITTIYSYGSCGVVGTRAAMKSNNNRTAIDEAVDKFIISPFYIATFFCLFSILFLKESFSLLGSIHQYAFLNVIVIGLFVFVGHLFMEILEATIFRKDPLRILEDKEALILSSIYLLLITMTSIVAVV